jgi:sigma-B regulation protein RsbU (phosphoserine phosphatase)
MGEPTPILTTTEAAAFERRVESLTVHLLECYEELDLIYRLSRRLKSTLDAQGSAEVILDEAMEIFEAECGFVAPADPAAPAFAPGHRGERGERARRLAPAVVGSLLDRGRSRIFESGGRELGVDGTDLPESLLCSVLKTEGTVYGALCVGRSGPGREFTARDLKLADVLSSQAAIGIENWMLQRKRLLEQQALIRFEEELRLARVIQSGLLPPGPPRLPGYDIACRGVPAKTVGGDYYDFIPVGDGRLAVCLADVSGHGMPAALLMANLQATIRCQAIAAVSPAECVRRSNRLLYRSTEGQRFATCFYGVLETRTGRITYSNAGHDHPLLLKDGESPRPLATGGLVLGVHEEPQYEEAAAVLEPGDLLVIYSDGITEFFDGENREFGVEGLTDAVARARSGSAAEILEEILRSVGAHGHGRTQADDMTLVVMRRL